MANVLVTGGAGFIGSHLVDALVEDGHRVRVVDARHPFAHLEQGPVPHRGVEYLYGNIGGRAVLRRALEGTEVVFHLAAALGMKQSMEYVSGYVHYNTLATAQLLEYLGDHPHSVRRLVVASSNTVYGEGPYRCPRCAKTVHPSHRSVEALRRRKWEQTCPDCGGEVSAVPTPESKPLTPTSIYAITKRDQEEISLVMGRSLGIPTIATRFFNVYGPGQSLFNPYAGVCALFQSTISRGRVPRIFEDGKQTRDLVSVHDVVRALRLAGESTVPGSVAINVGSGIASSMLDVAQTLADLYGMKTPILPNGEYRDFDVRHSYADIAKARTLLGYVPQVSLREGLGELARRSSDR